MFKFIVIVVAALIIGVLGYATTRPDDFTVTRSASIQGAADRVFALIDDFKQWQAWSPWEKKDPAMQRTFGATTHGKGASYAWSGNKEVGKGSMEIIESAAPSRIVIRLDFIEPFASQSQVEFTLTPKGDATEVRWSMQGPVPYFAKIIHLFVDMDRVVGADFETGLANLKAAVERGQARAVDAPPQESKSISTRGTQ